MLGSGQRRPLRKPKVESRREPGQGNAGYQEPFQRTWAITTQQRLGTYCVQRKAARRAFTEQASIYGTPRIYQNVAPYCSAALPSSPLFWELPYFLRRPTPTAHGYHRNSLVHWTAPLWPQLIGLEVNTSPRLDQSETQTLETWEGWDPESD